jgi:signal transduction histidine kinase
VRDLSLGLRPSMLDDFGLQAALEWHVRDFMTRYRINVELTMRGNFSALSDKQQTCVYRAVQEALTNCARHAKAAQVSIDVTAANGELSVAVRDDGVGLDPARRKQGLGLLGIEERVKELHGTLEIARGAMRGTALTLTLPMVEDAEFARVAS